MAGVAASGGKFSEQRVVLLGAGSAATGITSQIVTAMRAEGLTQDQARRRIWLVDSQGLVHSGRTDLDAFKLEYAQPREAGTLSLLEVVKSVHPSILIGTAAQPQAFTEDSSREMARHVSRLLVCPLANPTSKS